MRPGPPDIDGETSLAARAAWLYFAGGLTQVEIARRLNIPSMKAHRLVSRASRDGLIRVFVDASVAACVELEERLVSLFGLAYAQVAPELHEGPLPLRALGLAGATYLKGAIERGGVIGIGNGRTLSAAVDHLPSVEARDARFVSVLGGLTRKLAANPFDVIHRLAEKTGGDAYLMPAPIFANSREDKAVLLAQMGIAEAVHLAASASPILAGIGELTDSGFLVGRDMIRPEERRALARDKAVGEILGHFFTAAGETVPTELSARAISLDLDALKATHVVAIAGGADKGDAILAVLRSGLLKGLITDEATACALVEAAEATEKRAPRKNGDARTSQKNGGKPQRTAAPKGGARSEP